MRREAVVNLDTARIGAVTALTGLCLLGPVAVAGANVGDVLGDGKEA